MTTRVLIVDDSAFARKVLRETLSLSPLIDVVGIARDGLEALEQIAVLKPDVITLDLMMPNLDGLGVLRELLQPPSTARVILVSSTDRDSEFVIEGLRLGAFDVVKKSTSLATDALYELSAELTRKVLAAGTASGPPSSASPALRAPAPPILGGIELVVIGTSTGGPSALGQVLRSLPASLPVPIVVALHIPADYTPALARRLNEECALEVIEAEATSVLHAGRVVIAKGGSHLRVERRKGVLSAFIVHEPNDAEYFPSVDLLFESAAAVCHGAVLGVVLTGMGHDGLKGSRAIVAAGGAVITEAEESCVVYGMPRCVEEARLSSSSTPLKGIAAEIVRRVHRAGEVPA
ncbi:MAG: chemotaxis-specific protein-glutamate methyltransferase CheB [Deltaproteobacteria bacterium]|nr:chemotaxis-specific protein-glutamate methyltransferase CheB [Deltaproteobacteria bacterium]